MLRLLLLHLAAVSLFQSIQSDQLPKKQSLSCKVKYYGKDYDTVFLEVKDGELNVCFNGQGSSAVVNDCIKMPQAGVDEVTVLEHSFPAATDTPFHEFKPDWPATKCLLVLQFHNSEKTVYTLTFAVFGQYQSGFDFQSTESDQTNVKIFIANELSQLKFDKKFVQDTTSCRFGDDYLFAGGNVCNPKTQKIMICEKPAKATTSKCDEMMYCSSKFRCTFQPTCTVSGSSIINFKGQILDVPDRCGYTLLKGEYQVIGVFKERRRTDVSFLDELVLVKSGVVLKLKQGGVVTLNDKTLDLTKPQEKEDLQISKDNKAITVVHEATSYKLSVAFDGNTARITMMADNAQQPEGLCGWKDKTVSKMKSDDYSPKGCEKTHSQSKDETINCDKVKQRCGLLNQALFAPCKDVVSPDPFISACSKTLCKYPAVDGADCQFLDAYAQVCSNYLKTFKDWKEKASCPLTASSCGDKACSPHEFCNGDGKCSCRGIFANEHLTKNTLGPKPVCSGNSASQSLYRCLLEGKGIDYTKLHLNDKQCNGKLDSSTGLVTFSFDGSKSCGTVMTVKDDSLMYKNSISVGESNGVIDRQDQFKIKFGCSYAQTKSINTLFKMKKSNNILEMDSGKWEYTLKMASYTDKERKVAIAKDTELMLDQTIWVEISAEGLDDKMVAMVIDSCWATNEQKPTADLKYHRITAGCADSGDKTVKITGNGAGASGYFSFNMFQFIENSSNIFLHCKTKLCPKEKDKSCEPTCNKDNKARKRRSLKPWSEDEKAAIISVSWSV